MRHSIFVSRRSPIYDRLVMGFRLAAMAGDDIGSEVQKHITNCCCRPGTVIRTVYPAIHVSKYVGLPFLVVKKTVLDKKGLKA